MTNSDPVWAELTKVAHLGAHTTQELARGGIVCMPHTVRRFSTEEELIETAKLKPRNLEKKADIIILLFAPQRTRESAFLINMPALNIQEFLQELAGNLPIGQIACASFVQRHGVLDVTYAVHFDSKWDYSREDFSAVKLTRI